jgi:dTDP-4-amino-4,6-dideoxygalactose transaminase
MSNIPLVDLNTLHNGIRSELDEAIKDVVDNSAFIMGERLKKFEEEFAAYCGAGHAVGASSGTTALVLAVAGLGIGDGEEVIIPSHTFIATAGAIMQCGAVPVLVDIDPETYNIDPEAIESAITPRTKAVMPVHLYGQCADLDPIMEVAGKRGIAVIEDACQAHGASYKDRRVGGIGAAGCFSFFPGKNLGAMGDGGMVTTNDGELADRMAMLSNHGSKQKYHHEIHGFNYRMDALQAAVLRVKLRYLDEWNKQRRELAKRYGEQLAGLPIVLPVERFDHVYHLYVIQSDERDTLLAFLHERGIGAGMHYPIPLHLQPCMKDGAKWRDGGLPVTERVASRVLSLPIYPGMTEEQQDRVIAAVREFHAGG